jgi:hypothetical protein
LDFKYGPDLYRGFSFFYYVESRPHRDFQPFRNTNNLNGTRWYNIVPGKIKCSFFLNMK